MTVHALAEVPIADLELFLSVFGGEGLAKRAEHRCLGASVFTPLDQAGNVVVLLEFPDEDALAGFRNDPSAPPIMRRGGAQGPPTFRVLSHHATFDH